MLFTEAETRPDLSAALTPVEIINGVYCKRDDLFVCNGVAGGKVRTCLALAHGAAGLVTAGSRSSPQVNIVAHIAQHLGIPARAHTPCGQLLPELVDAQAHGCEIIQETPGHNSVIIARAREDAKARGWVEIPFGMECYEAVRQTRGQVRNVPRDVRRVIMPVGSGMSLAGVLWGLQDAGLSHVPVVGTVVGASPVKRLEQYAPSAWRQRVSLQPAGMDYHDAKPGAIGHLMLDPFYEAKAALTIWQPGDLFWVVGIRATAAQAVQAAAPAKS